MPVALRGARGDDALVDAIDGGGFLLGGGFGVLSLGGAGSCPSLFADTIGIALGVGLWALARRFKPQ